MVAWHDHELVHVKEWSRPYQKGQEESFVSGNSGSLRSSSRSSFWIAVLRTFDRDMPFLFSNFDRDMLWGVANFLEIPCAMRVKPGHGGEMSAFSFPMLLFKHLCVAYHDRQRKSLK